MTGSNSVEVFIGGAFQEGEKKVKNLYWEWAGGLLVLVGISSSI